MTPKDELRAGNTRVENPQLKDLKGVGVTMKDIVEERTHLRRKREGIHSVLYGGGEGASAESTASKLGKLTQEECSEYVFNLLKTRRNIQRVELYKDSRCDSDDSFLERHSTNDGIRRVALGIIQDLRQLSLHLTRLFLQENCLGLDVNAKGEMIYYTRSVNQEQKPQPTPKRNEEISVGKKKTQAKKTEEQVEEKKEEEQKEEVKEPLSVMRIHYRVF